MEAALKRILSLLVCLALSGTSAAAADVSRSFSYFSIHGKTLEEIERQLNTLGPYVDGSRQRHPGAVRMEFKSHLGYGQRKKDCRVTKANVTVKAKVILPRWRDRKHAELDVRLIWDTLERDIQRHEESHLVIAQNHARDLEEALRSLPPMRSCAQVEANVKRTTARILARHDAAQAHFDRVENINFEDRILRLLTYRLEQIEAGRIKQP